MVYLHDLNVLVYHIIYVMFSEAVDVPDYEICCATFWRLAWMDGENLLIPWTDWRSSALR